MNSPRFSRLAFLALLLPALSSPEAQGTRSYGASVVPGLLGQPDWEVRYEPGLGGHDTFQALALDSVGNVIVVGQSLGTYAGPFGTAYTYEITTQKYTRGGALLWERRHDGLGHGGFDDKAVDVLVRPDDSVVVLGNDQLVAGDQDVVVLCYDESGNELWKSRVSAYWNDGAVALAEAADGGLFVLANLTYGQSDIGLTKFSAAGGLLWSRHWNGGVSTDYGVGLALDPSGNVTIGGNAWNGSSYEWAALEYDADGNLLWSARFGPGTCYAFHLDAAGDVVLAGGLGGGFSALKLDGAGAWQWTRTLAGTSSGITMALTSDAARNLLVVGGATVASFDEGGATRWVRPFLSPQATNGTATGVVLDELGHVLVSGNYFATTGNQSQVLTAAYGSAGRLLSVREHGGPRSDYAAWHAVAVGPNGAIYVAGNLSNSHDNDGLLLRY